MNAIALSPIATRFAWKEYRTLRSFWLAAFVIAALLQASAIAFAPRSADPVASMFGIALAAAALYAVGVAATTFSMEHEEETYAYLTGLPTRWLPLFTGKCSFAAVSSFLLAAALLTSAWLFAGGRAPNAGITAQLFAGFGFGIVEMLAWGIFYSLLIRQPLLAALLAIGTESLAVTWTANFFGERSDAPMTLNSYANVLGPRLAVALSVLAVDVLLARGWLVHERQHSTSEIVTPRSETSTRPGLRELLRAAAARIATLARHYSPRVLSHLLWQALRQSWKPMLAMSLIVPGMCFMLLLVADMLNVTTRIRFSHLVMSPFPIALLAMAIYWSVVFYADQRQFKYRFLAEHAVWPRYVWLSRLLVWSLPIVLVAVFATIGSLTATFKFIELMKREFNQIVRYDPTWETRHLAEQWGDVDILSRSLVFGLWGAGLGAALGQATSLFFRRALVAGFAALVLSVPLWIWGFAAWIWELEPLVFLLPIPVGLIAATWLRVSDWLVDRNSFASWAKVAAALVAPLAFIAWQLPTARTIPQIEQYQALANLDGPIWVPNRLEWATALPIHADQTVSHWISESAAEVPQDNQAIVDRLVRLGELIEHPQHSDDSQLQMGMEGFDAGFGSSVGSMPDEYVQQMIDGNRAILSQAAQLARSDYRLVVSDGGFGQLQELEHWLSAAGRLATRDGELDVALDYHLAALTLWNRLWTGQPTNTYRAVDHQLQTGLVEWASAQDQTSARIKSAIAAIDNIFPPVTERQSEPESLVSISHRNAPPQILAIHEQLRAIILGKEPTRLLEKDAGVDKYVAVMSNELPLERARALTILDFLTISQVAQWRDVIWRVNQQLLQELSHETIADSGEQTIEHVGNDLRGKIRAACSTGFGPFYSSRWQPDVPPYSWLRTSPFLQMELSKNRNFGEWLASAVNIEIAAWGLRQQLALLAYKADHGKYPEFMSDLVPDYLPFVPIDPYSGHPFEYRPHGLSLELRFSNYQYESIPAHTPLLWSVGANGQQLDLTFYAENGEPADPYSDQQVRREVYQFSGNVNWYDPIIFRLPTVPNSLDNEKAARPEDP